MARATRGCLWLTAIAAASLTTTGCHAAPNQDAAAEPNPARSPIHAPSASTAVATRPSLLSTPVAPVWPLTQHTTPPSGTGPALAPGALVLSDGSRMVRIGDHDVRFRGPVTDAAVSPNGTHLAYVDGHGNIAVARLDGTGARALTSTDHAVRRSQPTFEDGGSEIIFSERGADGVWRLKGLATDGHDDLAKKGREPTLVETKPDHGGDTAPSATYHQTSHTRSATSRIVFQHRTRDGVDQVYILDRNQRGPGASALLPGSSPAVAPTGDRVAFIEPNGQLAVQRLPLPAPHGRPRPNPQQITWVARPTGHLAWSPDGTRLVFSTDHDVESVSATPVAPGSNPATVVSPRPGVAAWAGTATPSVGWYEASDPVAAAVRVSRAHFVDGRHAPMDDTSSVGVAWRDRVTLVSADDPSSAAVAATVAAGGPLLFTRGDGLDPRVAAEITRILRMPRGTGRSGTVDLVGGADAIPSGMEAAVRQLGFKTRRIDPSDAPSAAAKAARGRYETYVVVSSTDLAGVVAGMGTYDPVLLTEGSTMPAATARKLDHMPHYSGGRPTVYAVGVEAQSAVAAQWPGQHPFRVVDVGGQSPAADSLGVVAAVYDAPVSVAVSASAWRDQLIASMIGPVLTSGHGLEKGARSWLSLSEAALLGTYVVGAAPLARTVGQATYGAGVDLVRDPRDIVSSVE